MQFCRWQHGENHIFDVLSQKKQQLENADISLGCNTC